MEARADRARPPWVVAGLVPDILAGAEGKNHAAAGLAVWA